MCCIFVLPMVATVLTVYGIETAIAAKIAIVLFVVVATALTVYGIEAYYCK